MRTNLFTYLYKCLSWYCSVPFLFQGKGQKSDVSNGILAAEVACTG